MIVCTDFKEIAEALSVKQWEVQKGYENGLGRGIFFIGETRISINFKNGEINFVICDFENNEDCKEYLTEYKNEEYDFKVYVDDIEEWKECRILSFTNNKLEIIRATVLTESGTQLNRVCKFVLDEEDEDFKPDGCIYYWEV